MELNAGWTLESRIIVNPPPPRFVMPTATTGPIGYLGPAGSWTHQACLDLFGGEGHLVALACEALFEAYRTGAMERICVPVTTSLVGVTPYLDDVLDLPEATVVAEYPKMLGYSLLAQPGARLQDITEVLAHPVALQEVAPWLDRAMPHVRRTPAASGGAAAQAVAQGATRHQASLGPRVGATVYGLAPLVEGIEEGPHNVTRWWVLGRAMPAPTGRDKTSLLASTTDDAFGALLSALGGAGIQILTVYERPGKKSMDAHHYLIEVAGHATEEGGRLAGFLPQNAAFRLLGSYPRK
jgi:prephenate dehydratase